MNAEFLSLEKYEQKRTDLINLGVYFEEHKTSKRNCLVFGSSRYYQKFDKEDIFLMSKKEVCLLGQVSRECQETATKRTAPFNKNSSLYMCYSDRIEDKAIYTDVVQIDINAAYLTAAKNRQYIKEKTFKRFFEIEENEKEISRKLNLQNDHLKSYSTRDGEILKYSKICRLISLGMLAQNKTVTKHFPPKKITLEEKNGRIKKVITTAPLREETENKYSENLANIFFTCTKDIDTIMFQCMQNFPTVYFYWVDAIFCGSDDVEKICEFIKNKGFDCKTKKHSHLQKQGHAINVFDTQNDYKPYFFNISKRFDIVQTDSYIELKCKKILQNYKNKYQTIPHQQQLEQTAKILETTPQNVQYFCNKTGYKPIQYIAFLEFCKILNINSIEDYNLIYLSEFLKKNGFIYSDFVKIMNIQATEHIFDDFDTVSKVVAFSQVSQDEKNLFGERKVNFLKSKTIPCLDIFDTIVKDNSFFI